MSDQGTYWVITSRAKGDANNPFGGSATSNQTSQLVQMTEDQIRQEYQDSGQLQDKFGSFDNYMGYINDSQEFVQSAEWMNVTPEYRTGSKEWAFLNGEDLAWGPGQREQIQQKIIGDRVAARTSAFQQWMGSEAGSALMQKYGIEPEILNDDGDKFKWTGSGYQKTYKVDDHAGVADYVKMGLVSGLAAAATPAIAGALGGIGGAALPAGVAGPAAPLISGKVATGIAAGATSAASQGILTGSVDPASVLSSAVLAGVNPGGYVADNWAPWVKEGELVLGGTPPSSFYGGFVSGSVNDAVQNGIVNGEFNLGDSLTAGLKSGGINSALNAYDEFRLNSQDAIADRIQYSDPTLTREQAMDLALTDPLLNTTDFGALIGDDGLFSFIPRADLTGIRNITDAVGSGVDGVLNGFELGDYMVLPDKTRIPMEGMTDAEYTNYTENMGGQVVTTSTMGLLNNPVVDGAANLLGKLLPSSDGSLSENLQAQKDLYDQQFVDQLFTEEDREKFFDKNGNLTVAGTAAQQDFTQLKMDTLASFNFESSGGLNENYSWSENPRGQSELWGTMVGVPGLYSTGSQTSFLPNYQPGTISPPLKPDGTPVTPLNFGPEFTNQSVVTPTDPSNAVLPSNNDTAIRNQGFLDLISLLNDDSKDTSSSSSSSNTETDTTNTDDVVKDTVNPDVTTPKTTPVYNLAINDDDTVTLPGGATVSANIADSVMDQMLPDTNSTELSSSSSSTLPGGGGGGGLLPGRLDIPSGDSGLPPLWTELYAYKPFNGYKDKRNKLYSEMMNKLALQQQNSSKGFLSSAFNPRLKELREAGLIG